MFSKQENVGSTNDQTNNTNDVAAQIPVYVDTKKYKFMAFAKLRMMTRFIQENFLPNLGEYKARNSYSEVKYEFKKQPEKTQDEYDRIKKGELEYEVENVKVRIKLNMEQKRRKAKDFKIMTEVRKYHVIRESWRFLNHMDDEYILMARAISFYLMVMAYEDNYFSIKDDNVNNFFGVRYHQDWITLKKANFYDLLGFDLSLSKASNACKKIDLESEGIDTRKRLHFSKDFAEQVFTITRAQFKSNDYKLEIKKYKESCRNIVEFMIKLIMIQNNIVPKSELMLCQSVDLQIKIGSKCQEVLQQELRDKEEKERIEKIEKNEKFSYGKGAYVKIGEKKAKGPSHAPGAMIDEELTLEQKKLIPNFLLKKAYFSRGSLSSYCEPDIELFRVFHNDLESDKDKEFYSEVYNYFDLISWKREVLGFTNKKSVWKASKEFYDNVQGIDGSRYNQNIIKLDFCEFLGHDTSKMTLSGNQEVRIY